MGSLAGYGGVGVAPGTGSLTGEIDVKVMVDKAVCQDHAQCCYVTPEVFRLGDDGHLVYDPEPADSLLSRVEDAADVCPVQAISYEA